MYPANLEALAIIVLEIERLLQKHDERTHARTHGQRAFYNLPYRAYLPAGDNKAIFTVMNFSHCGECFFLALQSNKRYKSPIRIKYGVCPYIHRHCDCSYTLTPSICKDNGQFLNKKFCTKSVSQYYLFGQIIPSC